MESQIAEQLATDCLNKLENKLNIKPKKDNSREINLEDAIDSIVNGFNNKYGENKPYYKYETGGAAKKYAKENDN